MKSPLASLGWWSAVTSKGPIRILAVSALVDSLGTGIALITLPFFAIRVAGLSGGQLALALSVGGVCELMAAMPNGVIAGRIGVRKFFVVSMLLQALAYGLLAYAHGLYQVLPVAALAGLARAGTGGLWQVLTVAVVGEEERAEALGSIRGLRNIGYLAAGALSSVVLSTGSLLGLRLCLLANAASFMLCAYWIARLPVTETRERPKGTSWSVLRDLEYFGLIASAAVFSSSLLVLTVGLPLWSLSHRDVPHWSVSVVVTVNTLLVILFQYRFSTRLKTVPSSISGIRKSAWAFAGASVLIALTVTGPSPLAVLLLVGAAVAMTLGELLESPSFWTLSFELAPAARKSEYMAAFDLNRAVIGIAGPPAMVGIVALGAKGWLAYAVVLLIAAYGGAMLARHRERSYATVVTKGSDPVDDLADS